MPRRGSGVGLLVTSFHSERVVGRCDGGAEVATNDVVVDGSSSPADSSFLPWVGEYLRRIRSHRGPLEDGGDVVVDDGGGAPRIEDVVDFAVDLRVRRHRRGGVASVLSERWALKSEEEKRGIAPSSLGSDDDDLSLSDIMKSASTSPIKRVRKRRMFDDEVTDDEQLIIKKRVDAQRRKLALFERREKRRRTGAALKIYPHLNVEEVYRALLRSGYNEDAMVVKLEDVDFLKGVRRELAKEAMEASKSRDQQEDTPRRVPGTCMVEEVHYEDALSPPQPLSQQSAPTTTTTTLDGAADGGGVVEGRRQGDVDDGDDVSGKASVACAGGGTTTTTTTTTSRSILTMIPGGDDGDDDSRPAEASAPPLVEQSRHQPPLLLQANMSVPEDRSAQDSIALALSQGRIIRRPRKEKGKPRCAKLKLDDAVKMAENNNFEGWSDARIRAFTLIDTNPNAYYYRFNAPNETQKNGKWGKEERELFFKRMAEFGVNGKWGIFSMVIPGRVGYQCSNFYRHLVESKQVQDDNYVLDHNGKAKYIFSRGPGRRRKEPPKVLVLKADDSDDSEEVGTKPKKRSNKVAAKRKRKRAAAAAAAAADDGTTTKKKAATKKKSGGDDDEYIPPGGSKRRRRRGASSADSTARSPRRGRGRRGRGGGEDVVKDGAEERHPLQAEESDVSSEDDADDDPDNPLPEFIDPITLDHVREPAISPYGIVMGYRSWSRCLQGNPICPLSKKPVKKRELVRLTWENIDQYREKIVNM